jgi:hypothetical protein
VTDAERIINDAMAAINAKDGIKETVIGTQLAIAAWMWTTLYATCLGGMKLWPFLRCCMAVRKVLGGIRSMQKRNL